MATFERCTDDSLNTDIVQHRKYPLLRLEPSIQKFLKVIQIDLARLHRHRLNVEKFNRLQDWTSLHNEQINATRTIQQIKANIHEIEKSRLQVCDDDLEKFDNKINNMKQSAIKSVCEFVELAQGNKSNSRNSSSDNSPADERHLLTFENSNDLLQGQIELYEPPENTQVAESWENLQENLEELNEMIHQFGSAVRTQQESVDKIEDNIEQAHSSVREGTKYLGKATKYKAAILPIAGAVVGTVIAGPIGLVAGAKIGGILGVAGGGVTGFLSGRYFKRRREKVTDMELSKLSRSSSLPDVHSDTVENKSWFGWGRKRNQSTAEVPGSSTTEVPGSSTTEVSGSSTAEAPGSSTTEVSRSSTTEVPVSSTADVPGSSTCKFTAEVLGSST